MSSHATDLAVYAKSSSSSSAMNKIVLICAKFGTDLTNTKITSRKTAAPLLAIPCTGTIVSHCMYIYMLASI